MAKTKMRLARDTCRGGRDQKSERKDKLGEGLITVTRCVRMK